jgi:hypothetical protein
VRNRDEHRTRNSTGGGCFFAHLLSIVVLSPFLSDLTDSMKKTLGGGRDREYEDRDLLERAKEKLGLKSGGTARGGQYEYDERERQELADAAYKIKRMAREAEREL